MGGNPRTSRPLGRVTEAGEVRGSRQARRVEGEHADESAGERTVFAAPAFIRNDGGVERRAERLPVVSVLTVEEALFGAFDLDSQIDGTVLDGDHLAGKFQSPVRPVAGAG